MHFHIMNHISVPSPEITSSYPLFSSVDFSHYIGFPKAEIKCFICEWFMHTVEQLVEKHAHHTHSAIKYDALSKRISSLPQHRKKLTAIMKFFLACESLCLAVRELTASATIMSQNLASGPHDKPSSMCRSELGHEHV